MNNLVTSSTIGYNYNYNEGYIDSSIMPQPIISEPIKITDTTSKYLASIIAKTNTEEGAREMNKYYIDNNSMNVILSISDVIIGKQKQTVVKWGDGTKTIVKCNDEDNFSPEIGVAMCIAKRMFGENYKSKLNGLIKKYDNKRKEEIKKRQEENRKKNKDKDEEI